MSEPDVEMDPQSRVSELDVEMVERSKTEFNEEESEVSLED